MLNINSQAARAYLMELSGCGAAEHHVRGLSLLYMHPAAETPILEMNKFILDSYKMKLNITMMPNPTAFKHSSPHRVASRSHLGEHRAQLVCGVHVPSPVDPK